MGYTMDQWQWYGTKTLQVCPYMPGTPVWKDGMLPFLYYKMKEEGKLIDLFCGDEMNLDSFVSFYDKLKTLQVLARVSAEDKLVPVGFSWVQHAKGVDGARSCECGEAFFDGVTKTPDARALAKLAVAYAFQALKVDVLFGRQVASNTAARNFSFKIGFKHVAVIPKMHVIGREFADGRLMMLEKEEFMPKFLAWKEKQDAIDLEPAGTVTTSDASTKATPL
jgi:hypothetical protein